MNYLDEVPFRTAMSLNGDSEGEITLVTAPDIELPDCTDILMSTMVSSHSGHRWGMLEGMSAVFSWKKGRETSWLISSSLASLQQYWEEVRMICGVWQWWWGWFGAAV